MVKHTQTIRWLLSTNCLSMFDHSVGLALKGITFTKRTLVNLNNCYCMKKNVMLCAIWYHFFNLKNVKSTPRKVQLLVKLQPAVCNVTKK